MRENKYKVWCKDKKEWERHLCFLDERGILFHYKSTGSDDLIEHRQGTHIIVFYTGLKDRNGVEIYEGDVYHHLTADKIGTIKFEDARFYLDAENMTSFSLLNVNDGEVIGNIHENPDLINS